MSSEKKSVVGAANMWIRETHRVDDSDILQTNYRVKKTLYSEKSDFQQIDVVDTYGYGKMLFNDGLAMVSERDEFVYHDMITHVPMFVHPNPKRVLVIGGGDGGTVREVIRHKSVEFCHLVEIDPCVVESCTEHIPQTSEALKDTRVKVSIEDGVKYLAETSDKFDVIIIDSTDPIGPAAPLFGVEFYQTVLRALSDGGIVVSQCESPFYHLEEQKGLLKVLKKVFSKVSLYNYTNITYPGGLWSFSFASNSLDSLKDFNSSRVSDSGLKFRWYSQGIHRSSFELPAFQKEALKEIIG